MAIATVLLYVGSVLRHRLGFLNKYNIPAPVIGGVVFAILNSVLRYWVEMHFGMELRDSLMILFFTGVGFSASFKMLKSGGKPMLRFIFLAVTLIVFQNVVAVTLSKVLGINSLMSLLLGSITMSGGHGTGAAFAGFFESKYQVENAMEIAMTAATFGIVMGSVIGGPLAERLITKYHLASRNREENQPLTIGMEEVENKTPITMRDIVLTLMQFAIAMSLGVRIGKVLSGMEICLPNYFFSLLIGIIIRNLSDCTGYYKVNLRLADKLGGTSLALFLVLSLMSLKLWTLAHLAGNMFVILFSQVLLMGLFAYFVTYRVMGKNYFASVLASGHCGFGLGATPNALANMETVTANYGPSPRALFIVSVVGGFFLDIFNTFIIQLFITLVK